MTALGAATARLSTRAGVVVALVAVDGAADGARRTAGAAAASTALVQAGCTASAWIVRHADDGRPLWPEGFTGSVSHTDRDAIVAVGTTGDFTAIGVDIELSAALEAIDAQLVLDERERAAVSQHPDGDWLATLLWSAKESAFKAWSTATEGGLGAVDPVDIHIELDATEETFTAGARGTLGAIVAPCGAVRGLYTEADGSIVTLAVLAARASG